MRTVKLPLTINTVRSTSGCAASIQCGGRYVMTDANGAVVCEHSYRCCNNPGESDDWQAFKTVQRCLEAGMDLESINASAYDVETGECLYPYLANMTR